MSATVSSELPFALTPEEVGISSEKMLELLREIKQTECHGFMVIRHGKVAVQWFKKPYSAVEPHAMYSVSKSITAIAIGFAVCEGLISLDDKVADYFPEAVPPKSDDNLKKVTLKHLISLTAGRNISPLENKVKSDWIDIFMKSKSDSAPGEKFSYVNECFHIALAMLRKVTGISTVEFLTPRLFEPLGIPVPFWECDHNGVEAGGWGIFLSATDFAKIALCLLNDGVHDNKQIIPSEWVAQTSVNRKVPKSDNEEDLGYGYGVWVREGKNPIIRFDGVFGQVAEIYKNYDAVTVVIGGDINAAHSSVMSGYFPESFVDEQPDSEPSDTFKEAFLDSEYAPLFSEYRSELESRISNRRIAFRKKHLLTLMNFQVSVLPAAATFMSKDKAGNITDVEFVFKPDTLIFSWREEDEKNSIECGLDGQWRKSKMRLMDAPFTAFASAAWKNSNTLMLSIRPQECVCARNLTFTFSGNKVKMKPESDPPVDSILNGVHGLLKTYIKSERVIRSILEWGKKNIEPIHSGKFIKQR